MPTDRVIDGVDQRAFFEGTEEHSAREGFLDWISDVLYGVKWRNFKVPKMRAEVPHRPGAALPTPHIINLIVDPKERKALDYP